MNNIFTVVFVLSLFYSFTVDRKRLNKAEKKEKGIYYGLVAATLLLFLSIELEVKLPLPTTFVIYKIVPVLNDMLHFY